jgi:hypothetical protein
MDQAARDNETAIRMSRRIERLTLIFGVIAALAVAFAKSPRAGIGIGIGSLLAWLNYHWLDQALGSLVTVAAAQEGSPNARVPAVVYWKFAGRYVLIGLVVYVSVHYFDVPILAVLIGLLALGAGAMVESLYQVFSGSA